MFFRSTLRKWRYWLDARGTPRSGAQEQRAAQANTQPLYASLDKNIEHMLDVLGHSNDVKVHPLQFGPDDASRAALLFVDGLVNGREISASIVRPIHSHTWTQSLAGDALVEYLNASVLYAGEVESTDGMEKVISSCLTGHTVLLLDGSRRALIISTKGWEKRAVTEPQSESVVRGPREGFTENLLTNTTLIRRRIKSPKLRIEHMVVGEKTRTSVCIAYIEDIAEAAVVEQLRYRINQLNVDAVLDSGYIEQYIEDSPFSVFPTVGYTEKPDVVSARVLEGRVAILVDGSPFALSVPMLFMESFQTSEDYYIRTFFASISRFLRYIAFLITVFFPGIYIAMTTFHQELIPTTLLFTIADAREGTPFPAILEAMILIFSFEILREAGLRLPRPVGQAISIVGALIMGDASVSAGLVGAPVVIAIAITAVAGFLVPELYDSSTVLRLFTMVLSAWLGDYGLALAFWFIAIHLTSLRSFGVPYFEGFTPSSDMKDSFFRAPLWSMVRRPKDIAGDDSKRMQFFIPPLRPHESGLEEDDE